MVSTEKASDIKTSHYYSLDAIRIFAASIVLLNHFASYSSKSILLTMNEDGAYPFLKHFYGIGAVGVEIFFVISGFVIASSASRGSGLSVALTFAYHRGRRIFPILWISSVVSLLAMCSIEDNWVPLLKAFIRSNVLFPLGPYIDGVVWSLIVEGFFYFVVALTILSSNPNRLIKLSIFIAILSIIYNSFLISYATKLYYTHDEAILSALHKFPFKLFLLRYGVFFSLGIIIFHSRRRLNFPTILLAFICFVSCIAEIISSSELGYRGTIVTVSIWATCVAVITYSAAYNSKNKPVLSLSALKLLKFLGNLSYPLYLNHYTLGIVLTYRLKFINSPPLKFLICLLSVLAVSVAVLYLEKIIRRSFLFERSMPERDATS
ncbi:acyltransferase [Methylobacterium sp. WL64]|uniref:acyltransferase family protein n=1 Tax=Methylobacterium sp. WL64 TaxID=2603894 RepID=UPI001FF053F5|nr:acyltransferase [Methylobacterium sp. WL64]